MPQSNKYLNNNYRLLKLELSSAYRTETIDLTPFFELITIFEGIYDNTIRGHISLSDADDFLAKLPIVGAEVLHISFSSDENSDTFDRKFWVTGVQDEFENPLTGINKEYTINFSSKFFDINKTKLISKAFKGKNSDLVKEMLTEIGVENLLVEKTKGEEQEYVIPNWHPFEVIDYMKEISSNEAGNKGFLFFENAHGHNFISLDTLSVKTPKLNITYDKNVSYPIIRVANNQKTEINKVFSTVENRMTGLVGSKNYRFDILNKKVEESEILNKDNQNPTMGQTSINNNFLEGDQNSKVNYFWDTDEFSSVPSSDMRHQEFNTLTESMLIYGNTNIQAGDVVNVKKPTSNIADARKGNNLDRRLSGNWLVSGIRHEIGIERYNMILELRKDAYAFDLFKG